MSKWIIQSWSGRRLFPDRAFDTFEDGWAFVREKISDEEAWEDIYVVQAEIEQTKPTVKDLGEKMLAEAGAERCQSGYGTTDPEWVGRYALGFGDINPDGTLN